MHNEDFLPFEAEQTAPDDKSTSQVDKLVIFARERVTLFHDANKDCYARHTCSGVVHRLESRAFRDWLSASFFQATDKAVREQSMREALTTLCALARCEGECKPVFCRVAQTEAGYFIDLCNANDSKVTFWNASGWQVIDRPSVLFVRSEAMQPLPEPATQGSLDALWQICNIPESSRLLFITWLIDAIRPDTPFAGIEFLGEQGSGKSTTAEVTRKIIDPNSCNLRGAPKTVEDIFVTAGVNHVVAYENLSHLSAAMQDAFCILSTGGGYAKRKLYSDADEHVISVRRPWIINSISACITQQDLLDRTISIECPVIQNRQQSANQWQQFEQALPAISGALLDVACKALAILPDITLAPEDRPRLIEFCLLGMAISQVITGDQYHFLHQFQESRKESISRTIDASPVCTALLDMMQHRQNYTASVKEIMTELERHKPAGCDSWPRSAKGLGDALRRSAPALRQLDIDCRCLGKTGGVIKWFIQRKLPTQSPASPQVLPNAQNSGKKQDIGTFRTSSMELSLMGTDKTTCSKCLGEGCGYCA